MVRTGAHGTLKYDFEDVSFSGTSTPNKKFGLQDKLSSFTMTNNKVDLNKLGQNTVDKFAYGQQQGTASIGFTLSNPWIFGSILGAPLSAGANPYTHTYPNASGIPKVPRTVQIEVGYEGDSANIVRTLKGGVVGSLSINAAVGGLVDCTVDITYGKESAPSAGSLTVPTLPTVEFPYTFAHAELTVGGSVVAQCQDASMSIAQNTELLYGLNSHQAVAAFRRVLGLTGSFRASWINKNLLEKVLAQIKADTLTTYQETIGGSPEFKFTFIKNNTNEKIEITGTGVGINDIAISGFEPVEPIFEEISWTMKTISVVATNITATEE